MPDISAAHALVLLGTRRQKRRKRVPTPRAPRAQGVAYAGALRVLFSEWHRVVRAELAREGLRLDAPIHIPGLRGRLRGLRAKVAEFFSEERIGDTILRAAVGTARFAQKEVSRVIGIPLGDVLPTTTIERFRQENIGKIQGLAESELNRLGDVLDRASATGLRVEALASDIQRQFDVSESYATLLARDQTLKLNGQITQERQSQAGIVKYTWITSRDERVRDSHRELDGTEQLWAVPPVVDEKTGRRAHPGGDYNCRCTASPVLDDLF